MKVGEFDASLIDLLGYVLPGSILVAASIVLTDWQLLGGRKFTDWGVPTLLVCTGVGYIVGHIFVSFQTQILGKIADICFGHRHKAFLEDEFTLTWVGVFVIGVRPFRKKIKQVIRENTANQVLSPFDLANQKIRNDAVLFAHERRLRALTIMFGNLVFCLLTILILMASTSNISFQALCFISLCLLLCFCCYGRYRLYRNRLLFRELAVKK